MASSCSGRGRGIRILPIRIASSRASIRMTLGGTNFTCQAISRHPAGPIHSATQPRRRSQTRWALILRVRVGRRKVRFQLWQSLPWRSRPTKICIVVGTFVASSGKSTSHRARRRRSGLIHRTLHTRSIRPSSGTSCDASNGSMNSSTNAGGIWRPRSIGSKGDARATPRSRLPGLFRNSRLRRVFMVRQDVDDPSQPRLRERRGPLEARTVSSIPTEQAVQNRSLAVGCVSKAKRDGRSGSP
jgi:hypothetical protein